VPGNDFVTSFGLLLPSIESKDAPGSFYLETEELEEQFAQSWLLSTVSQLQAIEPRALLLLEYDFTFPDVS